MYYYFIISERYSTYTLTTLMDKNRNILHKNYNASNNIFNSIYFMGIFYLFK